MNLILNDLTIQLNGSNQRKLIDHLSLTLNPKDRLAIIGEEGCGKTTLINYLVQPESINGYTTVNCTHYDHGRIGYLTQTLDSELMDQTISSFFFTNNDGSLNYDHLEKYDDFIRYASRYGFTKAWFDQDMPLSKLSGGQRMRYRLAVLLYDDYDVIIMDEPTNDLDIASIEILVKTILSIDPIIIFVSHDTYFLSQCATMILELRKIDWYDHNEHVLVKSNYDDYIISRQNAFDHQMQTYQSARRKQKAKAAKLEQIRSKVEYAQNQAVRTPIIARKLAKKIKVVNKQIEHNNQLDVDKPTDVNAIPLSFQHNNTASKSILWSNHYESLDHGSTHLLDGFTITLSHNEHIAIVGENGCGKTTLMQMLIHEMASRYHLGYLSQKLDDQLDMQLSPYDDLSNKLGHDKTITDKINTTLSALHLSQQEIHQPYKELSQGTLTKCILTQMVLSDNTILFLDEPTRNISPLSVTSLTQLLRSFHGAILCISHDRRFIETTFDTVYWFKDHTLVKTSVSDYLATIDQMIE